METFLDEVLQQKNKPDAIFSSSDKLTTGCLRYFKENHIKIPKDVALVGFSNSNLTDLLYPPLTVVKQPAFEMGQIAMQLLMELIESKHPVNQFETKVLESKLIIRESA